MNMFNFLFNRSRQFDKNLILGNRESVAYNTIYNNCHILAHYLQSRYRENRNMLVIGQNSPFFVTAYFAVMKSGNICVPIDPGAVTNEKYIAHILNQTAPSVILVDKQTAPLLGDMDFDIIGEDSFDAILGQGKTAEYAQHDEFDGSRIAQIIFTSGSTAMPKGVMLTHDNIIANTESIIEYLKLTSDDIIEVVLPFFYCYGLSLLHTHVRAGGSLVLNNTFFFLNSVIKDIETYHCTGFAGVPSHFQILLRKSPVFKTKQFPSLRYVTQAGGKLPNAYIQEFRDAFPDVDFHVMYGQTEATARLSHLPPDLLPEKLGSIGKGIPGVTLEVVDKGGDQVKPGEVGEIIASGNNIMAGYYKDPETTMKTIKNGRLHTGDLATVDDDGYIYITAREKEIIKVGGERISPKEIENVISGMPEVIDCLITRMEDEILGEAVCAYVVLNNRNITEKEIRDHCIKRLSINKVPKKIVIIDKIMTNSAGKKVVSV